MPENLYEALSLIEKACDYHEIEKGILSPDELARVAAYCNKVIQRCKDILSTIEEVDGVIHGRKN